MCQASTIQVHLQHNQSHEGSNRDFNLSSVLQLLQLYWADKGPHGLYVRTQNCKVCYREQVLAK